MTPGAASRTNNIQPYLAVNFCIVLAGISPRRTDQRRPVSPWLNDNSMAPGLA
jgi:hypothetical protein